MKEQVNLDTQELLFGNGSAPVSFRFGMLRERNDEDFDDFTEQTVRRFLMKTGLTDLPSRVLNWISILVYKSAKREKLVLAKEYLRLGTNGESAAAVRAKIDYYLNKNYDAVYATVKREYGCEISKEFLGTKNFVCKIGAIFYVFG
ncbi:MAG: hypothetical protein HFE47_01250 [Clostridia bacterium]|nr:hypothetical protein [Clostridia bacterium]